jgi:diguanylate cyclase (GGDEF)-like protein
VIGLADPLAQRLVDQPEAGSHPVVIGLTTDASLSARVEFARRGGRMLLPADTPPLEVADAVASVRAGLASEAARILVVDDDPALLELTRSILDRHGLDVTAIDDSTRFWQTLEAGNPDVVLLDLEMPGYSGLELCRAIRADPRWSQLPVLFLTARADADAVGEVFAAGADDYLTKPVVERELVQRIQNRLERIRLLRDLADRDALTGVANRRKATEQLAHLERIATRYGQPLTVAILDLDHFKHVNDTYGHEIGDEVLRRLGRRLGREFRGEDVVGRWGGEEFVVGMYGMPGTLAVERLQGLLEDWTRTPFDDPRGGEFTTAFSAGIAELPANADTLVEVQRAADEALYRAKAAGRGRVCLASEGDGVTSELAEIALVEDDVALVDLLTHSLTEHGWRVHVLSDGAAAIAALAGEPPLLQARLVLLDWNLPGVDGLDVLRKLRDAGVLARTRVVMLTARDSEADVVDALELGAADHLAKPVSVPVLVQKVRQILEAGR